MTQETRSSGWHKRLAPRDDTEMRWQARRKLKWSLAKEARKLLPLLLFSTACATAHRPPILCATLQGAGPDSDALDPVHQGSVVLRLQPNSIAFAIRAPGLEKVIASHIHSGEKGVNGPMIWEINS